MCGPGSSGISKLLHRPGQLGVRQLLVLRCLRGSVLLYVCTRNNLPSCARARSAAHAVTGECCARCSNSQSIGGPCYGHVKRTKFTIVLGEKSSMPALKRPRRGARAGAAHRNGRGGACDTAGGPNGRSKRLLQQQACCQPAPRSGRRAKPQQQQRQRKQLNQMRPP